MASEKLDTAPASQRQAESVETGDDTTIDFKGEDGPQQSNRRNDASDEKALETLEAAAEPTDVEVENTDPEKGTSTPPAAGKPMLGVKTDEDGDDIVGWDGPDDPQNPYNWPSWSKVAQCGVISALTFFTPLASCKWPSLHHITAA